MFQDLNEQLSIAEHEGGSAMVITQSSSFIMAQGTPQSYGEVMDFWCTLFKLDPRFKALLQEAIDITEVSH